MRIKMIVLFLSLLVTQVTFARIGGDDVGNGGFAYKQSVIILKMATSALSSKIANSTMDELSKNPKWKSTLQEVLTYQSLDKLSKQNRTRGGRLLQMDYEKKPTAVVILKPYFDAFAGVTDNRLEEVSDHVQKLLVHEAAHIWGYNEDQAEEFAIKFLKLASGEAVRPKITIKNWCSCLDGKADMKGCDNFCASKPSTDIPTLYVEVDKIIGNPLIRDLNDWCYMQLMNDNTAPRCVLHSKDENNNIVRIAVNVQEGSNLFSVRIPNLEKNRPYSLKLVEDMTGGNAESTSFQVVRKFPDLPEGSKGMLDTISMNQFTCLKYGLDSQGSRNSFAKKYYYYTADDMPSIIFPSPNNKPSFVCHDEILHPGNDSATYERLELLQEFFYVWDKYDPRFVAESGSKKIDEIIRMRLEQEYGVIANIDLFKSLPVIIASSSSTAAVKNGGFILSPFKNVTTGKTFCPTSTDFTGPNPLFQILKEYISNTEGLYIAEKEGEVIGNESNSETIYGNMYINQSQLMEYGFYIQNGAKIRVNENTLHARNIFFYWPADSQMDPLEKGNRKLFTVKSYDSGTTDKRIGCIPKSGFVISLE